MPRGASRGSLCTPSWQCPCQPVHGAAGARELPSRSSHATRFAPKSCTSTDLCTPAPPNPAPPNPVPPNSASLHLSGVSASSDPVPLYPASPDPAPQHPTPPDPAPPGISTPQSRSAPSRRARTPRGAPTGRGVPGVSGGHTHVTLSMPSAVPLPFPCRVSPTAPPAPPGPRLQPPPGGCNPHFPPLPLLPGAGGSGGAVGPVSELGVRTVPGARCRCRGRAA